MFCSPFTGTDSNAPNDGVEDGASDAGGDTVTPPGPACPGATTLVSESFNAAAAVPPSWTTQLTEGGTVSFEGTEVFSPPGSLKANAKIISNAGENADLLWVGPSGAATTHLSYVVKMTEVGGSGAHIEYGCTLTYLGPADHTTISLLRDENGNAAALASIYYPDSGSSMDRKKLIGLPTGPLGWCKVSIDAVVAAGWVTAEITVTAVDGGSPSGNTSVAAPLGDTTQLRLACGVPYTTGAPETVTAYVDDVLLRSCPPSDAVCACAQRLETSRLLEQRTQRNPLRGDVRGQQSVGIDLEPRDACLDGT